MKLLTSLLCVCCCLVATLAEIAVPEVIPGHSNVYQSTDHQDHQKIELTGSGFKSGISFTFDPPLKYRKDYSIYVVNDHLARLQLTTKGKWRSEPGQLIVKTVTVDNKVHVLGGEEGIVIANILADPVVIDENNDDHYGGQTHEKCDNSCQFAMDGVCDEEVEFEGFYSSGSFITFDTDAASATNIADSTTTSKKLRHRKSPTHTHSTATTPTTAGTRQAPQDATKLCARGTDCQDCSGSSSASSGGNSDSVPQGMCTNTCMYPRDGLCDDPRGSKYCALGTDCQDCGPVGADNFTHSDDDGWWDDEDDYWNFNDASLSPLQPPSNPTDKTDKNAPPNFKGENNTQRKHRLQSFVYVLVIALPLFVLLFVIVELCRKYRTTSSTTDTTTNTTTSTNTKAVVEGGVTELVVVNSPAVAATGGVTFV